MLEGRKFCIYTDHKPSVFALHRTSDAWSARQQQHLSYVAEFTSDIRHVAGKDNQVADALSRPATAVAAVAPAAAEVDFERLAEAQKNVLGDSSFGSKPVIARSDCQGERKGLVL
jgi:hypothetical protein